MQVLLCAVHASLKIGKILFILGSYFLRLGNFLDLGTIPETGVGFIARKITESNESG